VARLHYHHNGHWGLLQLQDQLLTRREQLWQGTSLFCTSTPLDLEAQTSLFYNKAFYHHEFLYTDEMNQGCAQNTRTSQQKVFINHQQIPVRQTTAHVNMLVFVKLMKSAA